MVEETQKENVKKVYLIGHTDVDGIASIALAKKGFKPKENEYGILLHDPSKQFSDVFAEIVVIADIAVTFQTFGSLANIHAKTVVWIDHHRPYTDISALKFPANVQVILDPSAPSASLLVQKYFNLNDEISKKIVELGTKADQWQLNSEVQDWMDVVAGAVYYQENPEKVVSALETLDIAKVQEILTKYRSEKEEAKKELIKNTVVRNIKGHSVAIGLSPEILSGSESADILLKNTNSEVQIVLKKEGWMSFRRAKTSTVNLITLAKAFGGGGHEYASGAVLGKSVTLENFEKIADEIFSKIESVL